MAQQPFTQQGVNAKQNELYNLSDSALLTECNIVAGNFRQWFKDNFILDTDQTAYINEIPAKLNAFYGWRAASALLARAPFSLGLLPAEHRRTKETVWTDSCGADYTPPRNGNPFQLTLSGQVTITFIAP